MQIRQPFIFNRESYRPANLAPTNGLPGLMRLGEITHDTNLLPAIVPALWRESLSLTHESGSTALAVAVMEDWCSQLLAQAWGRIRVWVFNPSLEATFTAIEGVRQIAELAGRKGHISFLRTRGDLEAAVSELKKIASERKARFAQEKCSSWKDIVNSDAASDFCLLIMSDAGEQYNTRIKDEIIELISHGSRFGVLCWSIISRLPARDLSHHECERRKIWVSHLHNVTQCNFIIDSGVLSIRGCSAKLQPFSTYNEFGGILPAPLTTEEHKILFNIVNNIISSEKIEEKRDFLELEIGRKSGQPFTLRIGPGSEIYHGMLAGGTGKGKTLFLKNLIVSACEVYSPDEVQFHIFDFKDGVDLACLEGIAHIAHLHTDCSEPQAVIDSLSAFVEESKKRNSLFKNAQNEGYSGGDLFDYNKWARSNGRATVPYRVLVIDETARLFSLVRGFHDLQKRLIDLLTSVASIGRSPGLGLLLASQSFSDLPGAIDGLKSHIQLRMSLQLNRSADCYGLFGSGNAVAYNDLRSDQSVREILINTDRGRLDGNQIVQLPKMDHSTLLPRIESIKNKWGVVIEPCAHIASDVGHSSDKIHESVTELMEIRPDVDLLSNMFPSDPLPDYPK